MKTTNGPVIHLNGTSAEELEEQTRRCVETLDAALNALYQANPHARDYYLQGPHAFVEAQRLYEAQIVAVTAIHREWHNLLLDITEQIEERARR